MYQTKDNNSVGQLSVVRNQESGIRNQEFLLILSSVLCLLSFVFCSLPSVSFAQDEIIYDDKGRRDPFIALVTADGRLLNLEPVNKEARIVLKGIIYDKDGRSYAIINGEIVSAGDYIQGLAVFRIEENKVILLRDNKPVEYILEKEEP
jgi:hypothetical protein